MSFMWSHRSKTKKKTRAEQVISRKAVNDRVVINGSKEESFFDTMESLASDIDDDFFSVKGDSSPPHDAILKNRYEDTPTDSFPIPDSEPSSRKILPILPMPGNDLDTDLIKGEKLEGNKIGESNENGSDQPPRSSNASSNGVLGRRREKSRKGMTCCIPMRSRPPVMDEE